ncbi:hypothetical protein O4214_29680 [Rhodococcus erythropolis]|uniref:hypothetical protein n=1 Tax=Rhodococcus erythropolis TaxID=1833 RepID=UPI001E5A5B2D|nr:MULTISPECIES: hypothetical protein [Rhodococcus erythropolis group]MCD2109242.1 hypothetical protein [Rhodococcus qingshengii]MCZ4528166.1 hypothetical protein [Rhodococcus erythropolis]
MGTKQDSAARESKAMRYSLVVAPALAVLAAFWGWISQSQVILLDGVYALIGMVLTALSLRVSRIADPASRAWHYWQRLPTPQSRQFVSSSRVGPTSHI